MIAMKSARLLCCLILLSLVGGCESNQSSLPTTQMKIGKSLFTIEIASTSDQQETGLMKRDSMPDDHGMIFIFVDDAKRSFWMKNTRIPLDIIFLDSSGKVVSIHQMAAYDLSLTSSDFPARYAVELNKGLAALSGLGVGDHVDIPPAAMSPAK